MKKLLLILLAVATLSAQTVREGLQRVVGTNTVTGTQAQVPFQVALLANLKAISVSTVTDAQVVSILGYTALGDGGGGQFTYSAASVTAPNDTTVVQPTVGAGRWLRISYVGLTTATGGTNGQINYNNSGVSAGFTAGGDATINTGTGMVTIANNAVTNAKAAQMATNTIKGNNTGGTANAADLTTTQTKTLLAIANTDVSGLGTMSTQNANAVSVTGGTMAGVAISGGTITGLSSPSVASDAATKGYADTVGAGIHPRTAVRLASTANIASLSGLLVVDGVTTVAADRVLVKNQTTTSENGIYDVASGAWSRSVDSNTAGELLFGYYYFVSSGSTNQSTSWFIQTAPTVLGTDPVIFSQFAASQTYTAGTNLSLAGNVFSIPTTITGQTLTGSAFNGTVGETTPAAASVTTLSASSTVNGAGITSLFASPPALGATTPAAVAGTTGAFTGAVTGATFAASSNANIRTTKASFNLRVVNVRDYGAVGDGSTDDLAAINSAIAALTSYSALYFPPGNYKITGGFSAFASISNVLVYGEGARIYSTVTGAAGNTFVVNSTCSNICFRDLVITGSATTRGSGIHIRLYSSNSSVVNCKLSGCSDFAIHVSNDGATWSNNVVIANNIIDGPMGDGIHVGNAVNVAITGNVISNTGDDAIGIIADTAAYQPNRITVTGNQIYNSASAGIRINEVTDVLVTGNNITTTVAAGIEVNRYLSTTAFNTRVQISDNKLHNTQTSAGPLGSIWVNFCQGVTVSNNKIDSNVNGNGIAFLDCNDLVIQGNQLRAIASRGIGSDDTTTANVAANCYRVIIVNNSVLYSLANQAIYAVAPTGTTINDLVIQGNTANTIPAGDWIYYNRITTGRITNNTRTGSQTITAGGTVSGVTTANNN